MEEYRIGDWVGIQQCWGIEWFIKQSTAFHANTKKAGVNPQL